MKRIFYLLFLGIVVIIAAITNPSLEDHREAVQEKVHQHLEKRFSEAAADSDTNWGEIGNALGLSLGDALAAPLIKSLIKVDNYVVFSLTQADWEEETHTIGIGIFGQVLLSPKIDEKLEEIAQDQF